MSDKYNIAIVGANGLIAKALLELLDEHDFPVGEIFCLDNNIEDDDNLLYKKRSLPIVSWDGFDFSTVDIAFFADVDESEVELTVTAGKAGAVVITTQPAFRYAKDIPLVVAGVNDAALESFSNHNIVAIPDATSTQVLQVLKPMHEAVGLQYINVTTCQSVSELGEKGVKELAHETAMLLNAKSTEGKLFGKQIAFNLLPQVGELLEDGQTRPEKDQANSLHKVLEDNAINIDISLIQAPVFFGNVSELMFSTYQPMEADVVIAMIKANPALELVEKEMPTPVTEAVNGETIYVSRIRHSANYSGMYRMTVMADNVRIGIGMNMLKIAQTLIETHLDK